MAPRTRPRIVIEAGGQMLLNNVWTSYVRIIPSEEWALLSKLPDEDWNEVYEGADAERILSDLIDEVIKTLEGRPSPGRVDWVRVTEVKED